MEPKVLAFEYFVYQLFNWYKENSNIDQNDLSTLKVLKLLFFCSAIDASEENEETLIDNPFNNFYAMPYGHVESDVYNYIRNNQLYFFRINNTNTTLIEKTNFDKLSSVIKNKIDDSFTKLKNLNIDIFKMTALELVELSHLWYSWKYCYSKAKNKGFYSELIPSSIIKAEEKILFLN